MRPALIGHGDEYHREYLLQGGEVVVLGCGPGSGVVDRPGDQGPVQPPASVCGQAVEEEALGAPVALPEWVEVVNLVVVIGQPFNEPLPVQVLQVMVLA